jgi:hypothetical protein
VEAAADIGSCLFFPTPDPEDMEGVENPLAPTDSNAWLSQQQVMTAVILFILMILMIWQVSFFSKHMCSTACS